MQQGDAIPNWIQKAKGLGGILASLRENAGFTFENDAQYSWRFPRGCRQENQIPERGATEARVRLSFCSCSASARRRAEGDGLSPLQNERRKELVGLSPPNG
jgi:hypothetical protein